MMEEEGGSIAAELQTMTPWPPRSEALIGRMELKPGTLDLYFIPGPRLRAVVTSQFGTRGEAVSGLLNAEPDIVFGFALSCGPDLAITLAAAGQIVGKTGDENLYNSTFDLKPVSHRDAIPDLPERNVAAFERRQKDVAGRTTRPGRKAAPIEYAVGGLRRELEQLDDLLGACAAGQRHHVFGVATRLRLLVARGRNMHPLLQLIAGTYDLPLIVHALHQGAETVEEGMSAMGLVSLRDRPGDDTMDADLDVWLELRGAIVEGKPYTNNEMIRAIGDTVGAHFDPDLEPLVEMMDSMHSGTGAGVLSEFDRWVLNTAYCVKQLGGAVMAQLSDLYSGHL